MSFLLWKSTEISGRSIEVFNVEISDIYDYHSSLEISGKEFRLEVNLEEKMNQEAIIIAIFSSVKNYASHFLSWLVFPLFYPVSPVMMWYYMKLGHESFLPHLLKCTDR